MFAILEGAQAEEMIEMVRALQLLERAKQEFKLSQILCLMAYAGQTEKLEESLTKMLDASPYETLTRENIMERARKISTMENPCDIDFANKTVRVASFANDDAVIEVMGNGHSERARNVFFSQVEKMGLASKDAINARMDRLRQSPAHTEGGIPLPMLLRVDVENEKAGHPLCSGCMVHHEDGKPVDKRSLH